jgi:hypothetical protein
VILLDALRTFKIKNLKTPIGTPIQFNGKTIGAVVGGINEGYSTIAINSNKAYSLLRCGNYRILRHNTSIEVAKSD